MQTSGFIIFSFLILLLHKGTSLSLPENQNIRKEVLKREFKNQEVQSIEIVEIEHPMLGGIINLIKLNEIEKKNFLSDFDRLKKRGLYKCKVEYIIRIIFKLDTLRLKTCGNMISSRTKDIYYELPHQKSMINNYLKK